MQVTGYQKLKNHSTIEKACLAIIGAIKKFIPYFEGCEFEVVIDHVALK